MGITTWFHAREIGPYSIDKENGDEHCDYGGNRGSDLGVFHTMWNIMDKFDTQLRTIPNKGDTWLSRQEDDKRFCAEPIPKLLTLDEEWWNELVWDEGKNKVLEWGDRPGDTAKRCEAAWHVREMIQELAAVKREGVTIYLCWDWT